jgi:hypothetical protein
MRLFLLSTKKCLDHVIVLNERHLRRVLKEYVTYYHRSRTHLGLGKDTPQRRRSRAGMRVMWSARPS